MPDTMQTTILKNGDIMGLKLNGAIANRVNNLDSILDSKADKTDTETKIQLLLARIASLETTLANAGNFSKIVQTQMIYTDNRTVGNGYLWKLHFQYTKHVVGTPLFRDTDQTWRPTQNGIYSFDAHVQVKNTQSTTILFYLYKNDQPYLCDHNVSSSNNQGGANTINVKLYLTTADWVDFRVWNPSNDWEPYIYNVMTPTYYKPRSDAVVSGNTSVIVSWISCTYLN